MADREAMHRLITDAYTARSKGNVDALMDAFCADATFELVGDKAALHLTGAFEGHSNVKLAMTQFAANFEFVDREITRFLIDGDNASVHSTVKIRYVPKNLTVTTEVVDLFRFKNGKIAELVEFADTALVKQMTA